uniref:Uncharacterized protein n=1 Tax=Oryza barthii TaxID=65489 RepID=A0A0D3H0T0_9ORYZ
MVGLCSSSRFDLVFEMKGRWRRKGAPAVPVRLNEAVWNATARSVWCQRREPTFLWADCESGWWLVAGKEVEVEQPEGLPLPDPAAGSEVYEELREGRIKGPN